jgi:hypothetical protein
MAVCVLFECPGVTQSQYDEALKKVTGGRAGKTLADWSGQAFCCMSQDRLRTAGAWPTCGNRKPT